MTKQYGRDGLKSEERRRFLEISTKYGFTAAVVAGAAGALVSSEAAAQTAKEEKQRQRAAEHSMTMATAYILGASRSYPIMQLDFKENIQNATNGKVYVKLAPGGQLGAGGALAQKVQNGTIQAAQHSLSNFAPFAPIVDLINLPYFCGTNQKFVNLVNSAAWAAEVNPQVEAKGFKPLWYVVIDPRVVAVRKGGKGPVKTPADLAGIKFRVPGSKMLQQYYRMIGANPTPVAWGETPSAIKQGVADALDPAVGALYVFGFKDILSWVTFSQAVPDSQVYSCNLEWFNALPGDVKDGMTFASEITAQQNLAKVPAARNYAMAEMSKGGVQFYSPSASELDEWIKAGGYQRSEWDTFKKELSGSLGTFGKLEEAANTKGRLYVHDA
ncbi:MAG: TRAP transporter substrate-binding protein [Rhodospirillales bacterium]|nr:TRAP transporter substrate-binding protein [Rhodospirillales bacterium]MDH3792656.1 TRAP transporter substrate-binding protein [Rhodospirillales bacterium]MDH3914087.1 TRAP transporter substrate-binding protein [Rhodospirillales bacterium]MDH3919550.1 TRAP transporter substrate-binding protein [Rhodospirillales bacterium]MDH3968596.1 TRAP transporter substrate-binding protein [Rhodospirillales bacterium]